MSTPSLDLEGRDRHELMMRRESQRLRIGFLIAVAAAFELMGWQEIADSPIGTRQWRAPSAGNDNVRATLRPEDGGAVDLIAGALRERHISASALLGRLGALAKIGHGVRPTATPENRTLAARVLAHQVGVFYESEIERIASEDGFVSDILEQLAS